MIWDVPTAEDCPQCGQTLFKKAGRGRMKPFCINESCEKFLPEDKRGYYKKKGSDLESALDGTLEPAAEEKKPKGKKATQKKQADKKPAARKTAKSKEV